MSKYTTSIQWTFGFTSAVNVSRALLRLMSVTVFSFTHPPILSVLLVMLSCSRFLVSDFPLLVSVPFSSSAPLYGMTFLFLTGRNPLWTTSNPTWIFFFKPKDSPVKLHLREGRCRPRFWMRNLLCFTSWTLKRCLRGHWAWKCWLVDMFSVVALIDLACCVCHLKILSEGR